MTTNTTEHYAAGLRTHVMHVGTKESFVFVCDTLSPEFAVIVASIKWHDSKPHVRSIKLARTLASAARSALRSLGRRDDNPDIEWDAIPLSNSAEGRAVAAAFAYIASVAKVVSSPAFGPRTQDESG